MKYHPELKWSKGRSDLDFLGVTTSLSGKPAATVLDVVHHRASVLSSMENSIMEFHGEMLGS